MTACVILLSQIPLLHPVTDSNKTRKCFCFCFFVFFLFCFFFCFFGGCLFVCFLFCFFFALFLFCVCVCVLSLKLPCGVNKKNEHKDKIRISCRWLLVHNQYLLQQVEYSYMYVYALIKVWETEKKIQTHKCIALNWKISLVENWRL